MSITTPKKQPKEVKIDSIKVGFRDLTLGQVEKLNELLAKTSYKNGKLTIQQRLTVKEMETVINALRDLPYKDVADLINLLYNSGIQQVKDAQTKKN